MTDTRKPYEPEWKHGFETRDARKARAETAERQVVELAGNFAALTRLTSPKRDAKGGGGVYGIMDELIRRAEDFATAAHRSINQRRKYTGEPYITHPARVAACVAKAGVRDEVIAAAWLHDVVEDTPVTLGEIEQEFGRDVASLV